MFKFHMAHVHIHQRCSRKKIISLRGDYRNGMIAFFSHPAGSGNARDAIANNNDMLNFIHSNSNCSQGN